MLHPFNDATNVSTAFISRLCLSFPATFKAEMNSAPGPSRPSVTTPLLASPRHRPENRRDPSTLRYNSLPSLEHLPSKRRRTPHVQFIPLLVIGPILIFFLFVAWDVSSYGKCYFRPLCRVLGDGNETKKDVWWRNSGPYAPYRSLGPGGGRTGLPRGCEIDQVNVVRETNTSVEEY